VKRLLLSIGVWHLPRAGGAVPLALNLFQERINNYDIEIIESYEFFAARGRILRTAEYRMSNIQPQKLRSRTYCKKQSPEANPQDVASFRFLLNKDFILAVHFCDSAVRHSIFCGSLLTFIRRSISARLANLALAPVSFFNLH